MKIARPCLILAACFYAMSPALGEQYTWTNFAGWPGGSGDVDGAGSEARFEYPGGVVVDGSGNTYVADTYNHKIRKITAAGVVTTLAGGLQGSADGTGTAAGFCFPNAIALGSGGILYVADTSNHTIRKITSAGVVTTLAGSAGEGGSADGTGGAARFASPKGLAVDAEGNLLVADTGNHTIRKITSAGVVTTYAGIAGNFGPIDGPVANARFSSPEGVGVDGLGNVFVADTNSSTIRKISSDGQVSTFAGTPGFSMDQGSDGTGSQAHFYHPKGLAVDSSGNIYVADTGNYTIRKITSGRVVTTLAGRTGYSGSADGTGNAARFLVPGGVAVDGSGNVHVADGQNHCIRKITSAGVVSTYAGSAGISGSTDGPGSLARFAAPSGLAADSAGNVYVADFYNYTIRKITSAGGVSLFAGTTLMDGSTDGASNVALFDSPSEVAVDGSGNVFVSDRQSHTIRKISSAGMVTTLAGTAGDSGSSDGPGSFAGFYYPRGLAVGPGGVLYVADSGNNTIRKITSAGQVTTLAGNFISRGSADGTGTAAKFYTPTGVAVDPSGNLYVTDWMNHTVRKITSSGVVTTFAGSAGNPGSVDGTGSAARFNFPEGIAADSSGNLYVADFAGRTIRKITSAGVVTTIGGNATAGGSADGAGPAAHFSQPVGIAVSPDGKVYVSDNVNDHISRGTVVDTTPPAFSSVTISSSNASPAWARAGDTITLSFSTNEAIQPPAVTLLGASAAVANAGGNNWTATAQVTAGTAPGTTAFSISAADLASNAAPPVTSTLNASSVTVDTQAPTVTPPAGITLLATGTSGAEATFSATASDANGIASLLYAPPSGSLFSIGSTTVTITARDAAGNAGTATFGVEVKSRTPSNWRSVYFGTSANAGAAADTADPYHTGISNLAAFAFGLDPAKASPSQLPQAQLSADSFVIGFTQPAGLSGIIYGAEWSATLQAADWHPVTDTGSGNVHTFSIPRGTNQHLFLRLRVTAP